MLKMMPGGGLFLLLDKLAHHIPNPETFNHLFANWNNIREVGADSVQTGAPVSAGAHLASADGKVYFMNAGVKRWIMSPIAFNNFNFDWNKIKNISAGGLDNIPEGKSIY